MNDEQRPEPGTIAWIDLTVQDAEQVREFYGAVAGWSAAAVDMGGYSDYNMNTPNGQCVAGVCHSRGANAAIPAQWMIYILVADIEAAVARCKELGGEVIVPPKGDDNKYCVIRDPAGAVCALYQNA